jgi:hypothetical protein
MALTFIDIQTEVIARGFNYLSAGADLVRLKRWINEGVHEADRKEDWPYLLTTVSGAQPATIADARKVESVVDVAHDNILVELTRAQALRASGDLTTTGTAAYWYRTATGTAVYPVSTATFLTSYYKVAPDLSANGDVPLMPDEYRSIIVELACRAAFRDAGAYEAAADCMAAADLILGEMRESLLAMPEFVARTSDAQDD